MNIQVGTNPAIAIVCEIPKLIAAAASYQPADHYSVILNGTLTVGGGVLTPTGPVADGPGYATIATVVGDWSTTGPFTIIVFDGNGNPNGWLAGNVVAYDPAAFAQLATLQPNYAPSKAGDQMDLVNAPNATAGAALAADLLDLSNAIETGLTVRQCLRLMDAVQAGKLSISGNTVTIRNTADTKDRVVATTDTQGQRTAVSYDVS